MSNDNLPPLPQLFPVADPAFTMRCMTDDALRALQREAFDAGRRTALAASGVGAWQSIENAPKDGTYIMLGNAAGSWIGMYQDTFQSGWKPENKWQSMMLNTDHMPRMAGKLKPTNWMPIPAGPLVATPTGDHP